IHLSVWTYSAPNIAHNITMYANFSGQMQNIKPTNPQPATYITNTLNLPLGVNLVLANITGNANWTSNVTGVNYTLTVSLSNPPFYSVNATGVPSGSQYSPGKKYGFQINWNGSGTNLDKVLFEAGFNESTKNYTVNTFTGNTYYINFTDLAAGTYQFRWFANETGSTFNNTDFVSYTIVQNTSATIFMNLSINDTESNKVFTYPSISNASGSISSFLSWTLFRNATTIGTTNPVSDTVQLGAGFYNYTYFTPGNQNYSSATKQFNLTINK